MTQNKSLTLPCNKNKKNLKGVDGSREVCVGLTCRQSTTDMSTATLLKNQAIVEAIAEQLIDDLDRLVQYSHVSLMLEMREYHENCINEREIFYDARTSEKLTFDMLFELIVNSELQDIYDSLQDSSQKAVRNYMKDVYPDWRDAMV